MRRRRFTLLELLIVVALVALVLALAAPRVGRLPARLQAEHGLSVLQAAFDETSLRARATGQSVRLTLLVDAQDGTSRMAVSAVTEDPFALSLGGGPEAAAAVPAAADESLLPGVGALLPGTTSYPLPDALVWDEDTVREGTAAGADGPTFVFLSTGEAGGPALEFVIRSRRHRVTLDRLTGRADIRPIAQR